jgi:hypothetical protein
MKQHENETRKVREMVEHGENPFSNRENVSVKNKMIKSYKKRRRKKEKMWKFASTMNEFYAKKEEDEMQRKKESYEEKEDLFEEFDRHFVKKDVKPTMNYMESSIQEQFMEALMQCKLETKDGKCDVRAFKNNSAVCERCQAAETKVSNKNTNDMQRHVKSVDHLSGVDDTSTDHRTHVYC